MRRRQRPPRRRKPLALRVGRLQITGAAASFTDFTTREPFKRTIGPLNLTLQDFRTDPDNKNPYSFAGTTDAGERFAWSGFFYLDPLRSQGELTLDDLTLNKYAPLYQDFVRFEIRSGVIGVKSDYRFELSASNRVAAVTNTDFSLRNFRLGSPGDTNDIVDLTHFAVTGASVDLESRQAEVDSVSADGAKLFVERDKDATINALEAAKPVENDDERARRHFVPAALGHERRRHAAQQHEPVERDRPQRELHELRIAPRRPGEFAPGQTGFGRRHACGQKYFQPAAYESDRRTVPALEHQRRHQHGNHRVSFPADRRHPSSLSNLDLGTLDPYLEPKLNLFILGSRLGLDGDIHLRTPENELPQVTFQRRRAA